MSTLTSAFRGADSCPASAQSIPSPKQVRQNRTGFTLIELLVVLSIIALLASIVFTALNSARQKARDSKRLADIRQLSTAFELFFAEKISYPTTGFVTPRVMNTALMTTAGLVPKYLSRIPDARLPVDSPGCTLQSQNDYTYTGSASAYTLTFCLGNATGTYSPGPHTATHAGIK